MESRVYPARLTQTLRRERISNRLTTRLPNRLKPGLQTPDHIHTLLLLAATPRMSSWRLESILLSEEVMVKLQLRFWIRSVASCALAAGLCSAAFTCTAATNLVRLQGNSFRDDAGPFLGFGVSYFQALHHAKYDRALLNHNLALLASKGFNYVRILSMVSWDGLEIAPVTFTNRLGRVVPAWPDYWHHFRDLLELAGQHGLRVEVTIFADAQYVMPSKSARRAHLDGILENLAGREHRVLHLEVANEAWQNGFPGAQGVADLRAFAQYLADRTPLLVAITSNDDTSDQGIISLYRDSAADLATVHFSRDTRTPEGGWLPVRDSYRAGRLPGVPPVTSNEPIGPGSSVAAESDPIKLCSAAAFAYLANLPGYVFHSRAGIYGHERCCPPGGRELRLEDSAGINAFQHLRRLLPPDLASWTRNDGIEPSAPFTIFCNDRPNRYWPDVNRSANGCVRNIGSTNGNLFVTLPMGILAGGVTLEARRAVQFEVLDPLTSVVVTNLTLDAGKAFTLPQGPSAYIIKGSLIQANSRFEWPGKAWMKVGLSTGSERRALPARFRPPGQHHQRHAMAEQRLPS